MINMTRNVAVTYARERVRANVILPGLIDTDMVRVQKPEMNAATLALTPMGRIGLLRAPVLNFWPHFGPMETALATFRRVSISARETSAKSGPASSR